MNEYKGTNKTRFKVIKSLGGKCSRCGYDKCFAALELHHVELFQKSDNAEYIYKKSAEVQLEEAKKCILVCANCHREIHAENPVSEQYGKLGLRRSGNIPFGKKLGADGSTLENEDSEQKIIIRILSLRKNLSLQKICDILNSENIPTKYGKKWFPATIKCILSRSNSVVE